MFIDLLLDYIAHKLVVQNQAQLLGTKSQRFVLSSNLNQL